jgi:arylsulfatase A-like enzyme
MGVDDAVAEIVATLEKVGIRENTIIIFLSDNGFALGDHRLIGKACPYDACIHVPFVISYPGKISAPRVDSSMVLNIDIAPTLTELVGISNVPAFDGESFLPVLTDPGAQFRDGFLFEQYQDDGEDRSMTTMVPAYVGFRTNEWKYIEYETGEQELYNLVNDPYEMDNLIGNSVYDDVIAGLQGRIDKIRSR